MRMEGRWLSFVSRALFQDEHGMRVNPYWLVDASTPGGGVGEDPIEFNLAEVDVNIEQVLHKIVRGVANFLFLDVNWRPVCWFGEAGEIQLYLLYVALLLSILFVI